MQCSAAQRPRVLLNEPIFSISGRSRPIARSAPRARALLIQILSERLAQRAEIPFLRHQSTGAHKKRGQGGAAPTTGIQRRRTRVVPRTAHPQPFPASPTHPPTHTQAHPHTPHRKSSMERVTSSWKLESFRGICDSSSAPFNQGCCWAPAAASRSSGLFSRRERMKCLDVSLAPAQDFPGKANLAS